MAHGWPKTLADSPHACYLSVFLQFFLHYVLLYLPVFLIFRSCSLPWSWWPVVGMEAAFRVWLSWKVSLVVGKPPEVEPAVGGLRATWSVAMESVLAADALGYPFQRFLSGWFLGADPTRIKHGNLVEFVSCMMLCKWSSELSESEASTVKGMVSELTERFGFHPEPGFDPAVRFASFTKEPLFILHRSLLQYVATSFLPRLAVATCFLLVLGLCRKTCPKTGLRFWWRPGSRAGGPGGAEAMVEHPDLLFFHGLCGFTGYVPLLMLLLLREPGRGAILVETEDVSQCLDFGRRSSKSAVQHVVQQALELLNVERGSTDNRRRCVLVGHSLGTCPAVWVLEQPPVAMAGVVLIDPIVVLLTLPDVGFGFLYRAPCTLFDWLCFLWCTSEPGISLFFRRRFSWYNAMLDPRISDEVPTVLCLSEHDQMAPAATVRAYAVEHMPKAEISWWPGLGHSSFMGSVRSTLDVVRAVRKMT